MIHVENMDCIILVFIWTQKNHFHIPFRKSSRHILWINIMDAIYNHQKKLQHAKWIHLKCAYLSLHLSMCVGCEPKMKYLTNNPSLNDGDKMVVHFSVWSTSINVMVIVYECVRGASKVVEKKKREHENSAEWTLLSFTMYYQYPIVICISKMLDIF